MSKDQLKEMLAKAQSDSMLSEALKGAKSTEEASQIASTYGFSVNAAHLWRQRGKLLGGGQPTWRG
jgi:predicted ribosomally synthesized peptide with nif11-like leader